jgi:hypothetical protein
MCTKIVFSIDVCPVFDIDVDKCNSCWEIREQLSNGDFSRTTQFRIVS